MSRVSFARRNLLAVLIALVPGLTPIVAKTPQAPAAAERKSFEAASIRLTKEPGVGNNRRLPGGRFVVTRMPLRGLLRIAYGNATIFRPNDQIVGAPGWVDSDRFDIEAKAAEEFKPDADGVVREHLAMLRTLLEEKFKIKARLEQRELNIYALVRLREDRFGPQFAESKTDCSAGAPPPPNGVKCGVTGLGPGKGNAFVAMPMAALVTWLNISPAVDRIVYDKTALKGSYDFTMYFAPPFILGPSGAVPNPDVDSGPTVFTALQEQLGLKLEPRKGPVDVLVIDHIERLADGGQ